MSVTYHVVEFTGREGGAFAVKCHGEHEITQLLQRAKALSQRSNLKLRNARITRQLSKNEARAFPASQQLDLSIRYHQEKLQAAALQ